MIALLKKLSPNRVAAVLAAGGALLAGLAPVVADMDVTSTAGVVAGILAVVKVTDKWLDGWQKHEAREAAKNGRHQETPTW